MRFIESCLKRQLQKKSYSRGGYYADAIRHSRYTRKPNSVRAFFLSLCMPVTLAVLLNVPVAHAVYESNIIGSSGGRGFQSDCGVGSVLAGVTVLTSSNRMDAIGAWCVNVNSAGRWVGEPEQLGELYGQRFRSSEEGVSLCPRDHAVTGVVGTRGTEGYFVNFAGSVALQCQALTDTTRVTGAEVPLEQLGPNGEGQSSEACLSNYAARGLFGAAGSHVDHYGLLCLDSGDVSGSDDTEDPSNPEVPEEPDSPVERPDLSDELFLIPSVGGSGGRAFDEDCGDDSVLVGLELNMSPNRLDAITGRCVSVNPANGEWRGAVRQLAPLFGGNFGSSENIITQCPQNYAVVGITGGVGTGRFSTSAGGVQLQCQALNSAWTTAGPLEILEFYGPVPAQTVSHACQQGFPARSIYGGAGSHVDYYGFGCLAPNTPVNFKDSGQWSPVLDWPVIAIHAVLTPNGEVLTYGTNDDGVQGAHFYYDLWNPETGEHTLLENTLEVDSFCSAPLIIPETKQIIMPGGDARFGEGFNKGIVDAPILDTDSQSITPASPMSFARWYPTATTLPNGEILVAGGIDGAGNVSVAPEIYSPTQNAWRTLFGAADENVFNDRESRWWYPRHWVAPNGKIFGLAGSLAYYLDPEGDGDIEMVSHPGMSARDYTSTGVMYRPGMILQVGGRAANGAVVIDINGNEPTFREVAPPVAGGRESWSNVVVLPDGSVLLTGGGADENELDGATLTPELWDPNTETWTALPDFKLARLYHSTTLLLPDGRVFMGGGGAPGPLTNTNAEIFTPGYLLDDRGRARPRPEITSDISPQRAGDEIRIPYDSDEPIARVTLIRSGAVTHSFNMEQRFIELDFDANREVVRAALPRDENVLPPGYYLLFLIDADGVPSVAKLVSVEVSPDLRVDGSDSGQTNQSDTQNDDESGADSGSNSDTDNDSNDNTDGSNGTDFVDGDFNPDELILVNSPTVGTQGGRRYSVDCGEGSVLVGVTAWTNRNRMDSISPWCAQVDETGRWLDDPVQMDAYGKRFRSSEIGTTICPENYGVVGFTGSRGTERRYVDYAGSIALKCRALSSSVSAAGVEEALTQLGVTGVGESTVYCADDLVARGLFGGAGAHVDNYGLYCLASE